MKTYAWMLGMALALAPLTAAHAADTVAQEKNACKQQEQQKGTVEKTSAVVCAIKLIFQSRIRRRKDTEPVEMTVGSPPMQSDDTETPGPNNWEINLVMHADLAGGERRIEMPTLDVNYGLGDTLQFKYEVPYVFARQPQPNASGATTLADARGIGDSIFGVKYRFYDDKDAGLSLAIYPQVEFKTPGAGSSVSEGPTSLILPVIVTREFEHASITANAGLETSAGEHHYFASFGVGTRLTDHVALLAEIVGTNLNAADEKHVLLNFGVRRKISDTQSISAALGRDVYAGGDQREHTYFTFAYQKLFGK
jgi:hypothetical protein